MPNPKNGQTHLSVFDCFGEFALKGLRDGQSKSNLSMF